jgi:hypothetical protein
MVCKPSIVVYTVIFGGYDAVSELPKEYVRDDIKAILFTDDPELESETWDVVFREPLIKEDMSRSSKELKLRPHLLFPDNEYSLYIDGNAVLQVDPCIMLKWLKDHNIALYRHDGHGLNADRSITRIKKDLYHEAIHCAAIRKDDALKIAKQAWHYLREGHPPGWGLWSAGVLVRRHNHPQIIELGEMWWEHVRYKSRRDQISLPFCLWKLGVEPYNIHTDIRVTDLVLAPKKGHLK